MQRSVHGVPKVCSARRNGTPFPWRTSSASDFSGGAGGLAEGGGRGGHPDQDHVEGHRAADAHAQGGVQERPREDCLRDERVEPLQGGEGDLCSGGHGARGCGVPEGISN